MTKWSSVPRRLAVAAMWMGAPGMAYGQGLICDL